MNLMLPRAGWPFWTLNTLRPDGGMRQRAYRLHQMEWVLAHVRKDCDTYLSQGFFSAPCRRALHLAWCRFCQGSRQTPHWPASNGAGRLRSQWDGGPGWTVWPAARPR